MWVSGSGREVKEEGMVDGRDMEGVVEGATMGKGVDDDPEDTEEEEECGNIWLCEMWSRMSGTFRDGSWPRRCELMMCCGDRKPPLLPTPIPANWSPPWHDEGK